MPDSYIARQCVEVYSSVIVVLPQHSSHRALILQREMEEQERGYEKHLCIQHMLHSTIAEIMFVVCCGLTVKF